MVIYSDSELLEWYKAEYKNAVLGKINVGKSCIRFKNPKNILFALIRELCKKINPQKWNGMHEKAK